MSTFSCPFVCWLIVISFCVWCLTPALTSSTGRFMIIQQLQEQVRRSVTGVCIASLRIWNWLSTDLKLEHLTASFKWKLKSFSLEQHNTNLMTTDYGMPLSFIVGPTTSVFVTVTVILGDDWLPVQGDCDASTCWSTWRNVSHSLVAASALWCGSWRVGRGRYHYSWYHLQHVVDRLLWPPLHSACS